MLEFITQHWPSILLSLTTAGALALCRHFASQVKGYKQMIANKEKEELNQVIDTKLDPIIEEIEELRTYIRKTANIEQTHMNLIIASYKFRLVQLCKNYMKQGYMTQDQYDQLTEFYKLYVGLGGNGQAKEYYEKTITLEIK